MEEEYKIRVVGNIEILQRIIKLNSHYDGLYVEISKDKIDFQKMDEHHHTAVFGSVKKELFSIFETEHLDKEILAHIVLSNLVDFVKCLNAKTTTFEMLLCAEQKEIVQFRFPEDGTKFVRIITVDNNILSIGEERLEMVHRLPTYVFKMSANAMCQFVWDSCYPGKEYTGDEAQFDQLHIPEKRMILTLMARKIIFIGTISKTESVEYSFEPEKDKNIFSRTSTESLSLDFRMDLFFRILRTCCRTEDIVFSVAGDFPMEMKIDLGKDSYIQYVMAPMVDDEVYEQVRSKRQKVQ